MAIAGVISEVSNLLIDTCLALSHIEDTGSSYLMLDAPGGVLFPILTELTVVGGIIESLTSEILKDLQYQNVITEFTLWGHTLISHTAHGAVISMLREVRKPVEHLFGYPGDISHLSNPFQWPPLPYEFDVVNTWHNKVCYRWHSIPAEQKSMIASVEKSLPEVSLRRLTFQLMHEAARLDAVFSKECDRRGTTTKFNGPLLEEQPVVFSRELPAKEWAEPLECHARSINRYCEEASASQRAVRNSERGAIQFDLEWLRQKYCTTAKRIELWAKNEKSFRKCTLN